MDNITIGIPRSLFYYKYGYFLENFFKCLGFKTVTSPETNKSIIKLGEKISNDEMCLSLKIFLGHIVYLEDKCDYIVNVTINNYGISDQGCTNYLVLKELIKNCTNKEIINFDIDLEHYKNLYKEIIKKYKNMDSKIIKNAYLKARLMNAKKRKGEVISNTNKLYNNKKKILLAGHSYNIHDKYINNNIIKNLNNYEIIYSDLFDYNKLKEESKKYSKNIYWKENKEYIGAIKLCDDLVDGIILVESFPCNNDILVNEYIKNMVKSPMLNLIIDETDAVTGIQTRIESFLDIIE